MTASKDQNDTINLTITNKHARESETVTIDFRGRDLQRAHSGRVLTADDVSAVNTFDNPTHVIIRDFTEYELRVILFRLPCRPKQSSVLLWNK
jgi:alpha-L-arabinofuranosidase